MNYMFFVRIGYSKQMTEVWLLDKEKIEAGDEEGLEGLDTSKIVGLPLKYRRTSPGKKGISAFMGSVDECREAFESIGIQEAPVAWNKADKSLIFAHKDMKQEDHIVPKVRTLYEYEEIDYDGLTVSKFKLFQRFPGEKDWVCKKSDLKGEINNAIPYLDDDGVFLTVHPGRLVKAWLELGNIQPA